MANRNLLWREDESDWVSGILGIHVARAGAACPFSEMDGGDGKICKAQAQTGDAIAALPFWDHIRNIGKLSHRSRVGLTKVAAPRLVGIDRHPSGKPLPVFLK
jgi:hypothetical protein